MSSTNQNPEGRYWLCTIPARDWNPSENIIDGTILYIKGQKEQGLQSNFLHWQVFIQTKKVRMQRLKNLLCPSTHLELSRSTASETYVWKIETRVDGSQFEFGQKPLKRNSKKDWAGIKDAAMRGDLLKIAENEPQVFIQSYRTLKQISIDYMVAPSNMSSTTGIWIFGPPGVGKSHFARDTYGRDMYMKAQNKWWDGYQNQRFVLLDDLDTNVLGHYLKIWADKYAFMAESKGSSRLIRPEKFIVTSNYRINELFIDPVLIEAIRRRFYIIEIPMRRY